MAIIAMVVTGLKIAPSTNYEIHLVLFFARSCTVLSSKRKVTVESRKSAGFFVPPSFWLEPNDQMA